MLVFQNVARDSTSGASRLARLAAKTLAEAVERSDAPDAGAFWNELVDACRQLLEAKREMAPIINLVGSVLSSAEKVVLSGRGPDTARQAVWVECSRIWESGEALIEELGREGVGLVPDGATVATTSASESVKAILAAAAREGRDFDVLLSESRPAFEGASFASEIAGLGLRATLVADAALPGLVSRSTLVLLGADSISERDFVNKIGSYALALAARETGVPCYAAALLDKLIPEALRGDAGREHDGSELLASTADGVAVANRYFETVPLDLVTGIVTERGILEPAGVSAKLRERAVAPALLQILFAPAPQRD
jgi:translation initiation factor 2B subunit (eIF-2B alpha/beta/delta family)